jgi:ribosomal-protein-alanine N-acetyltransferase
LVHPVYCRLSKPSSADIASIEKLSNRPPWPVELFEGEFNHSYSYTFGARANGKLIGFLVTHAVLDEIHILNFGIDPVYRGNGVGRGLITFVLKTLSEERASIWATLEVRKSNTVAQSLYQTLGFSEVAIREKYYTDDLEDAFVLRLHIPTFIAEHNKQNKNESRYEI